MTSPVNSAFAGLNRLLPTLEELYKDVHAHPELSMQETRTAGLPQTSFAMLGMR